MRNTTTVTIVSPLACHGFRLLWLVLAWFCIGVSAVGATDHHARGFHIQVRHLTDEREQAAQQQCPQDTSDLWGETNARAVISLDDGGFVVAGYVHICHGYRKYAASEDWVLRYATDAWISRFDREGKLLWSKAYRANPQNWINAIAVTADGGFVVAGGTSVKNDTNGKGDETMDADILVWRLNGQGDVIWGWLLASAGEDKAYHILPLSGGDVAVSGFIEYWKEDTDESDRRIPCSDEYMYRKSPREPGMHCLGWIARLDTAGQLRWERRIERGDGLSLKFMREDVKNNRLIVAGELSRYGDTAAGYSIYDREKKLGTTRRSVVRFEIDAGTGQIQKETTPYPKASDHSGSQRERRNEDGRRLTDSFLLITPEQRVMAAYSGHVQSWVMGLGDAADPMGPSLYPRKYLERTIYKIARWVLPENTTVPGTGYYKYHKGFLLFGFKTIGGNDYGRDGLWKRCLLQRGYQHWLLRQYTESSCKPWIALVDPRGRYYWRVTLGKGEPGRVQAAAVLSKGDTIAIGTIKIKTQLRDDYFYLVNLYDYDWDSMTKEEREKLRKRVINRLLQYLMRQEIHRHCPFIYPGIVCHNDPYGWLDYPANRLGTWMWRLNSSGHQVWDKRLDRLYVKQEG